MPNARYNLAYEISKEYYLLCGTWNAKVGERVSDGIELSLDWPM